MTIGDRDQFFGSVNQIGQCCEKVVFLIVLLRQSTCDELVRQLGDEVELVVRSFASIAKDHSRVFPLIGKIMRIPEYG